MHLYRLGGLGAVALSTAHAAFLLVRPDLRSALTYTILSLALLVGGGLLAFRRSAWSCAAVGMSILAVVAMAQVGGEVDPFYLALLGVVLVVLLAAWHQGRS